MQMAKDTFYVTLRDGIAAGNPQRNTVVRGVLRPGVLVEENELETAVTLPDVFRMRWTAVSVDENGTLPLAKLRCEIRYETAGTAELSGMDRGRLLAAMDEELLTVLTGEMQSTPKMNYAGGTPVPEGTRIFWSDLTFGPAVADGDRIGRVSTVDVWSYGEAGGR